MAWVTAAVLLAGAAVKTVGSIKAAKAAKKVGLANQRAAESQAELADYNAAVADIQSQDAIDRGQETEQRFRTQVRGAIGSQRTGFAAGNIDVGFGSAVDVQADAAYLGELDALTIRTNAAREAWGYKVQSVDYRKRGDILRKEGVNAAEAGRVNANAIKYDLAGSLVGTAGSLLQAKYGMGKK
jgi:hypothetical protein